MTVSFPISPEENPREKFRRLLAQQDEKASDKTDEAQTSEALTGGDNSQIEITVDVEEKTEIKPGIESTPPAGGHTLTAPPPFGETPHLPPPAIGTMGMPIASPGNESGIPETPAQPAKVSDTSPQALKPKPAKNPYQPAQPSKPIPSKIPPYQSQPRTTADHPPVSPGRSAPTYHPAPGSSRQRPPSTIKPVTSSQGLKTTGGSPPGSNYSRQGSPTPSYAGNITPKIRKSMGCFARMFILAAFGLVFIMLCAGSIIIYEYYAISQKLPPIDNLRERTSAFETTYIRDREGNLLYEMIDPSAGRRTYVTLEKISPYLLAATLATEDKNYYSHRGFDPIAILRAFWQNIRSGETVSGASTITQQLVKMVFLDAEERNQRTYIRKVREALLAAEVTRKYSKDMILELYVNEINYGNLAYGIQAAAQTYFGVNANQLTLGQAAFLAGLPQAPSLYDVYTNREAALNRQRDVLQLVWDNAQEQGGCITVYITGNSQGVCIDADTLRAAYDQIQNYEFRTAGIQMRFPHWVNYIKAQLETQYDPGTIYRSGFTIYTTIDPALQEAAESLVKQQVTNLAANNATDGALVAINPVTGEILAMVGSADFYNEAIAGQVNMAVSPTRQPGSSIKPLTYLAAFEKGWTPSSLIWDVPTSFTPSGDPYDPVGLTYTPVNYDGRFHGPVTVRSALANSYNIPAVKTLEYIGINDDPNTPGEDGLIAMAKRLGITSFTRQDYGLSLTLGGGEVSLVEMTGAYAVLANAGVKVPLVSITRILNRTGEVVFDLDSPNGAQVVRPEHAYLISNILADNDARTPMFGSNSSLVLPFMAAVKTGTTNEYRDNWAIGYTPDIAVGVWVGNADNSPMVNTTGLTGAAPIWHDFMITAINQLKGGNSTPFSRPGDIIDRIICAVSGAEPSSSCPSQRGEVFSSDQPPLPVSQDLWAKVKVDTWTNLRASTMCGDFIKEVEVANVVDPWARSWLTQNDQGRTWAAEMGFKTPLVFMPDRECTMSDSRPLLAFISPNEGQIIQTNPLDIFGQADATTNFGGFRLEWGEGDKPEKWYLLGESALPAQQPMKLYTWDLLAESEGFPKPNGMVTLRLFMKSTLDTYAEIPLHISLGVPTVTPTTSPTPTPTETGTATPVPTVTYTPSPLPSDTAIPTTTTQPSDTPPPTETPAYPTETPTPDLKVTLENTPRP